MYRRLTDLHQKLDSRTWMLLFWQDFLRCTIVTAC